MNKIFVFALLAFVALSAVSGEDVTETLNPVDSVDANTLSAHEQDKRAIYYAPGYRYLGGYRTYGYPALSYPSLSYPSLSYPSLSYPSYPYQGRYYY